MTSDLAQEAPLTNGTALDVEAGDAQHQVSRELSRMGTWYDITSERRPQASWQFPSSERGGCDESWSGGRTGTTTDSRAPRRSCASSRPPRTSRPGRRVESIHPGCWETVRRHPSQSTRPCCACGPWHLSG